MSMESLFRALRQLLQDNILDPRTGEKPSTRKWIQPDYPRLDATFPRISIHQADLDQSELAIGRRIDDTSKGDRLSIFFEINIWVKIGELFTIGSDKKGGNELREYLGDQVIDAISKNKETFCSQNTLDDMIITTARSLPFDPDTRLYQKSVLLEMILSRKL